jgi:hypothetical protein
MRAAIGLISIMVVGRKKWRMVANPAAMTNFPATD